MDSYQQERHLIKKYNLEEKAALFQLYNVTPKGEKIAKPLSFATVIKECVFPEDMNLALEIFGSYDYYKLVNALEKEQTRKIVFPKSPHNGKANSELKKAFYRFYQDRDEKTFSERFGEFCFQAGKAINNFDKTVKFITGNFNLFLQPPKNLLPDGKPVSCNDENDIANAIEAAADNPFKKFTWYNPEVFKNMAEEFRQKKNISLTKLPKKQNTTRMLVKPSTSLSLDLLLNNKNDIALLAHESAEQLDKNVQDFGLDEMIVVLLEMKKTGQTALQISQSPEQKEKVAQMAATLKITSPK